MPQQPLIFSFPPNRPTLVHVGGRSLRGTPAALTPARWLRCLGGTDHANRGASALGGHVDAVILTFTLRNGILVIRQYPPS